MADGWLNLNPSLALTFAGSPHAMMHVHTKRVARLLPPYPLFVFICSLSIKNQHR